MTKLEQAAMRQALEALDVMHRFVLTPESVLCMDVQKKADALREALEEPAAQWVSLDKREMLRIIDSQEAYKQSGLPMFYRDQCMNMLQLFEHALKEKNHG